MAGSKCRSGHTVTETDTTSHGWERAGTRTEDQEKSYESKLGVQETKTIVLTRKAPKKQRLAATGAHPEKEMAFH